MNSPSFLQIIPNSYAKHLTQKHQQRATQTTQITTYKTHKPAIPIPTHPMLTRTELNSNSTQIEAQYFTISNIIYPIP
jgi:hypothetical protein